MKIGDILQRKPEMVTPSGMGESQPMPCTVVYIHPLRRFFVVEFCSAITGERWRQTEYFPVLKNGDNFNRLPIIRGRKG